MLNNTTNALLSVIIPAYNAEDCIMRAISSAAKWKGDDIEIVVVDDGSIDSTKQEIIRLSKTDPRIKLISQQNQGRSAARNAGASKSSGKWIMFLDADDYLLNGWQNPVMDAMKLGSDLVFFSFLKDVSGLTNRYGNCLDSETEKALRGALGSSCVSKFTSPVPSVEPFILTMSAAAVRRAILEGSADALVSYSPTFEWNACWSRLYSRKIINSIEAACNGELFPVGVRFSEDRLMTLNVLSQLHEQDIVLYASPIYMWDIKHSSTVANIDVDDPKTLFRFIDAVNRLDIFKEGTVEYRDLVATELASQFKRSASLPLKTLTEAGKIWESVLSSDGFSCYIPDMTSILTRRKYIKGLLNVLLLHGKYYLSLLLVHVLIRYRYK